MLTQQWQTESSRACCTCRWSWSLVISCIAALRPSFTCWFSSSFSFSSCLTPCLLRLRSDIWNTDDLHANMLWASDLTVLLLSCSVWLSLHSSSACLKMISHLSRTARLLVCTVPLNKPQPLAPPSGETLPANRNKDRSSNVEVVYVSMCPLCFLREKRRPVQ